MKSVITNPDKMYWKKEKITKGDLINYYTEISPYILPHLKNRPITLIRYPEGIEGGHFFQKNVSGLHVPKGIETVKIKHDNKVVEYLLIQNLASLLYAVNLGSIEIHPFISEYDHLDNPDFLVIDLDPEDISFSKVVETAQVVHEFFEEIGVKSYCKTSGKRGLHICIPLNKKYTFDQSRQFGEVIVTFINERIPEITSLERMPKKRQKKVYLDVLQNVQGKSIIAPYSARSTPHASVSTPLKWSEVKVGLDPNDFTLRNVPDRVKDLGDLFKPVLGKGIDIQKLLKKLEK